MRRGTVLSTKVAYVCRAPMRSVLTTVGGGQTGKKYRGPGGPEGGPNSVTYVFIFLGIITMCQLHKSTLSDQAQVSLSDLV